MQANNLKEAKHSILEDMLSYSEFKVTFILDVFNKTPLHYLVTHKQINYTSVNRVLAYICDYIEDCLERNSYEVQQIFVSLAPLFWMILLKVEAQLSSRFLTLCFMRSPFPHKSQPYQFFGIPDPKISYFVQSPAITQKTQDLFNLYQSLQEDPKTWDGIRYHKVERVDFRTNSLCFNYDVVSEDMHRTVICLLKRKNEDLFKTQLISKMIDHLWDQIEITLAILFSQFSVLMVCFSLYLGIEKRDTLLEIVFLIYSVGFLVGKVFQGFDQRMSFIFNFWNWIDILCFGSLITFTSLRMADQNKDVCQWFSFAVIVLGYLRWMSYFRLFKPTRNLIQVVIGVLKDIIGFTVIIGIIIVGYSLIYQSVYDGAEGYEHYLYYAYSVIYASIPEDTAPGLTKILLLAVISSFLYVVLLNLLISILGDTYTRVQEKRDLTDSVTRLEMLKEGITYLKFFKKQQNKKGFLVYCFSSESLSQDQTTGEWEGIAQLQKKLFKQNEKKIEQSQETMEKRISTFEQSVGNQLKQLQEKHQLFENNTQLCLDEIQNSIRKSQENQQLFENNTQLRLNEIQNVFKSQESYHEKVLTELAKLQERNQVVN